jgi:hypothetical protein
MTRSRFTQEWYETASEADLLDQAHAYDAENSAHLMSNRPKPHDPSRVYVAKGKNVFLTTAHNLKYLQKYGYTKL